MSPAAAPYLRRLADDKRYPVADQAILGRHSDCDIALVDEPGLSRKHARFHVSSDEIAISDIGSLNGTLVNGKVVKERCVLNSGDRLVFDEEEFIILIPDVASVSSEAPTRIAAPGAFELDDTPSIRNLSAEDVAKQSTAQSRGPQKKPITPIADDPLYDPNEKFSTTGVWQNNHVHPDAPIIAPRPVPPLVRYRKYIIAGVVAILALIVVISYSAGKQQTAWLDHSITSVSAS